MREFRSFGHTEKVGEAAQRNGLWEGGYARVPKGITRVLKEVLLDEFLVRRP